MQTTRTLRSSRKGTALTFGLLGALLVFLSASPKHPVFHNRAADPPGPKPVSRWGGLTDTTPIFINRALTAHSIAEYQTTAKGQARKTKYDKSFGGTSGVINKKISYPDGSAINLRMEKKPSYAGQPTEIRAHIKSPKDKKDDKDSKTDWTCTTDDVSLSATSTTFMNNDYSAQAAHIYPGAIYTIDNFYGGNYVEQTGPRNPLTICTDNVNVKGNPYITVANPNMATMRGGIDKIFHDFTGPVASQSFSYQIYQTENSADASMKISGGASGYGASVSAGYSNSSSQGTINLTIDAIKTLFNINCVPPDSGYFKAASVENTPGLVVIGQVTYGIRVLANLTMTYNTSKEAATMSASYNGFGMSAHVNFGIFEGSSSVNSTINCYVVGGPGNTTVSFDKKQLEASIQKILASATYLNVMPVAYQFYDMAGDVVGSNSATDNFAIRDCTPGDPRLESAYATIFTDGDDKNQNTNYWLSITPEIKNTAGVFQFWSGMNSPHYPNNTANTIQLESLDKPITLSEFTNNGGQLSIALNENGSDTWLIDHINVTLNFAGQTPTVETFTLYSPQQYANQKSNPSAQGSPIYLSNDQPSTVIYFDGSFKQRS